MPTLLSSTREKEQVPPGTIRKGRDGWMDGWMEGRRRRDEFEADKEELDGRKEGRKEGMEIEGEEAHLKYLGSITTHFDRILQEIEKCQYGISPFVEILLRI
ncbi:hypothetical protein V1477_018251 [Vespula maculifrons]|uniref:Uncharacterized protein n=1 Tax=Vespula maculifrons TaxID=7453 RepID=A0ABD2AYX3_VESMC